MHSIFHSKLLSALRLSSFAGEGLPERMRSISFALLGLTAAAGLALVAIFAQPGFTLISPAPLPDRPSASEAVAEAKKLPLVHRPVALLTAHPARPRQAGDPSPPALPSSGQAGATGGSGEGAPSAAADAPAPAGAPHHSSGNGGGGSGPGAGGDSGPAPGPGPAPDQPAASPSAPVSSPSPQPTAPTAPEATASAPKPEPAPAPGNSGSSAAAEHASERGVEASAGSSLAAGSSGATTSTVAPEARSPGNGNGLAKGQGK